VRLPRRRTVLSILALLALALGLFALGLFPQEPLRRVAETRLRQALGPGARIGRIHVVPGRLQATLEDVVLETPSLRAEVPRARLELGFETLTGGALSIRSLELDEPRILIRDSAAAPGAPTAVLAEPVFVQKLAVHGGRLTLELAALGGPVRIDGLDLEGSLGSGRLDVRSAGGEWKRASRVALRPAHARLRISPLLAVDLEAFDAGTARSHVSATGSLGRASAPAPDVRFEADLDLEELSEITARLAASGHVEARGHAVVKGAGMELEAELTPHGVAGYGVTVDGGRLRLVHRDGETTATPALDLLGGRLSGEAHLTGSKTRGDLSVTGLDIGRVRAALAPSAPALTGGLAGRLTWSGDLEHEARFKLQLDARPGLQAMAGLDVHAEVEGRALPAERRGEASWSALLEGEGSSDSPLGQLQLTAAGTLRGGPSFAYDGHLDGTAGLRLPAGTREVTLQAQASGGGNHLAGQAEAHGLGGQVTLDAEVEGPRARHLSVQGAALDLATAIPDLAGTARFRLEASGPLDRLALQGEGWVDGLVWRQAVLGPLEVDIAGDSRLPEARLRAPALRATGEARLAKGALDARIELSRTPLAPFSRLAPTPLEGVLTGSVEISGPIGQPRQMHARARLESAEMAARGLTVHTDREAHIEYQPGQLRLADVGLVGEGFRLEASGTLATETGVESDLHAKASADLDKLPFPEAWQVSGKLEADLQATGSRERPHLTGALDATSVTLAGPGLPPVAIAAARIELDDDAVVIPGLVASLAGGEARLSGRVPLASMLETGRTLTAAEEAALRLTWERLDAAALLDRIRPGSTTLLSGALSGEARLEGGLRSLQQLRADASIPKTTLLVDDLSVDVGPVSVELRAGVARLPETLVATQGGSLQVHGNVDIAAARFDAGGTGRLDLRALAPFLGDAHLSGVADLDVAVSGPFRAPAAHGTLTVADTTLRIRDVPQAVTDIRGRLVFDGSVLRIEDASAAVGGGPVAVTGSASLGSGGLADVDVSLSGKEMALRYPVGLRTRADAELHLTGRAGALRLEGSVKARSGRYDLDRVLQQSLGGRAAPKPAPSPLLRGVGLAVEVDVDPPIGVKSSLTDLRVGGHLSMLGDLETPEPYGQLDLQKGGKVTLQGRNFEVERGAVIYEGAWDPGLDVSVRGRIQETASKSEYDVTVTATGTLASPNLAFGSTSQITETEVRSLIATGTLTASSMESSRTLAGDQAAAFLAGRFGRGLADTLGLDTVIIQPQLLSRDQKPGANFIFGKRLTRNVSLAYSLSLNDAEERFIQLSLEPTRSVTGQVELHEDGTWAVGAGQQLQLWGPPRPRGEARTRRLRVSEVRLEAELPLPEAEMRKVLGLHKGSKVTQWDVQDKADKLRERLIRDGYLDAEVVGSLDTEAAVFRVQAGPRYLWVVEGIAEPPSLDKVIRSAFFADEALDLGRQRLLAEMRSRGNLRADVQARVEDRSSGRALVFTVRPGPHYTSSEVRFPGAAEVSPSSLAKVAGGAEGILASERTALDAVRQAYAEHRHFAAEAGPVSVHEEGSQLVIEVPVREGPAARLTAVKVEGSALPAAQTDATLRLPAGAPFDEGAVTAAAQRLRDHYLGLGYPRVRVSSSPSVVGPDVEVTYRVVEGPRLVVGAVEINGATRTWHSIILGKVKLAAGDPLDLRKLVKSEQQLRALALFRRVAITYTDDSPSTLRVEVEELPPVAVGYQLRYDRDDGLSGQVDAEVRNLAGSGLTLGGRYRRGADVEEERASLDLPSFFRGRFTASAFRLVEEFPIEPLPGEEPGTTVRTQRGFQVQQTVFLPDHWVLPLGYRLKRLTQVSPLFQDPVENNIAAVDLSVVRETRDNPLDSRRGRFWSFSLELAPKALGSDLTFVKGFAQAFFTRALSPSLTWAQGYRLGLATGFGGQSVTSSERFTAGGANSLRGFATDSVGPRDPFGDPTGGEAVLILNQELRLRHHSGLGGAVFYDGGNVYATVKDLSLDLRHVLGAGLRYISPIGLLRIDVGFPLNRQPGDAAYKVFFSVGQAF
jgi:outer membrane protein assembly complex protein YaeT